jgi:GntR family transcriptional regulator/MocR family aminotransferase
MKAMGALSGLVLHQEEPYRDQIAAHLIEAIATGRLVPGTRLPSIRALAAGLGVNRNTVARAIRELADKRYVETRFGGGSVVRLPAPRPPAVTPAAGLPEAVPFDGADWERRLARHLDGFFPSPVAPLFPPHRPAPINLYQMRPDTSLFPLERFRQCLNTVLRRSGRHLLNYGSPAGYLPLREQIAQRLAAAAIPVDPSQILIVSGSQQGIDLLARALLDPGERVVVESPTYSIALKIFAANGARPYPYPITREGVSLRALEQLGPQQSPKLFYTVPNFQNPTTHSYTTAEKAALLREAYRLGSVVIEDASDNELHPHPERWPALASLDRAGRVIYLNTFSKTLVPAVRVGYLCAPPPLVRRLAELKEMTDLSQSLILQAAVAEFMERSYFDEHVARVREAYRARMERVLALLEAALPPEAPFTRPEGGLCVWVDLPAHLDTRRLFDHLRGLGVLVSPGSLYQPLAGGRNGIRLCVAAESEARLAEGFAILGRELTQVLRRPPPTPAEQEYQATH